MIEVTKVDKRLKPKLKLRIVPHDRRTHSCTAYMIKNAFGAICGGNLMVYIENSKMNKIDYPTVFWRREAIDFLNATKIQETVSDFLLEKIAKSAV